MADQDSIHDGPFLLVPEGERVIVFFFPLKDGFGWPSGEAVSLFAWPHPSLIEAIRVLTGADESEEQDIGEIVEASLICHDVAQDAAISSGFTPMMEAFQRGFPYAAQPTDKPPNLDSTLKVVEVAVPLISMLARQMAESGLEVRGRPQLHEPAPDLVSDAFDVALKSVRHLQRCYAATTRRVVRLLSRQQLPPVVSYGVRNMDARNPGETTSGLFFINDRLDRFGPPVILSPAERGEMLDAPFRGAHALPYIDLYNQADVALRLEGNLRECAVMLGAASEVLLNRLMLTLRWEEGLTPEDSSRDWPDSLITRIKRELPPRLGGNWSLDEEGVAPQHWYRSVYALRNRVAHAGYEPTFLECLTGQQTLNDLISWIGDRLTSGKRLKSFPRTAFLHYPSRLGRQLERLPWLERMQQDPNEVPWSITSSRWIDAHERLVRDSEFERVPDPSRAALSSIWLTDQKEPTSWILTDMQTGLACEVEVDPDLVKIQSDRSFTKNIPAGELAVAAHARIPRDVIRVGPWVEQYHINPLLHVMVDRSDRHRPWPVHAVRSE
ncbi:hypothetical protein [Serinicoccus sp. CUA-874]|uniref:hypothetical protein n=1 Tax=Serinicoccus sp. CUA-874 TaxID=1517939 RepID=UPI001179A924|nr:hypothetical protein [Serinicoccus sp. CUA-874]